MKSILCFHRVSIFGCLFSLHWRIVAHLARSSYCVALETHDFSPTKWRNRKKALFCKVKWFRRGVDTFICNLGCRHAVTVSLKSFSIWAPNHLKDQKTHLFALATGEYSCHIIEMSTPTFIHQAFSSSLENPVPLDTFVWLWTLALGFMQIKQYILWMQPLSNKWLSFMSHYHCHKVHSVPVLLRWGDALWDEALVSTPWLSWSREKHSECIKHVAFIDPNGFKHPAIQVLIYSQHFTAAFQIQYDIFCNHPPEKSSTLSKFLGFCLVSLALLDRNMAPLAKLQESLTHDHILSAFLGIYMAPTCTYTIMFIHLLPFCVSQFSIYLSQYFSRSF